MKKNAQGIREIFVGKKYRLVNKGDTFCLMNTRSKKMYFLQFTTKDPWWIPRSEILRGIVKIYGWLFFYVGHTIK